MHHLYNVWINAVIKAASSFLSGFLEDNLENILSFLRVSHIIRAFQEKFSLTSNYHNGHGEKFRNRIIDKYPKKSLMHANQITLASGKILSQWVLILFTGITLIMSSSSTKLVVGKAMTISFRKELFACMSSVEMIAVSRSSSMLRVAIPLSFI